MEADQGSRPPEDRAKAYLEKAEETRQIALATGDDYIRASFMTAD